MDVKLDKSAWDDVADLIDAGFDLLSGHPRGRRVKEDEAYLDTITRSWDSLRKQLEAQGYKWDPKTRDRG